MTPSNLYREWQCPKAETSENYKLGWLGEACQQGNAWLESQRGFGDWRKSLNILSGECDPKEVLAYRSHLTGRRLKTNVRTAISGLANIRPLWGYHAAPAYAQCATMLNKTTRALYLEGFWDQSVKEVLAYAAATNSGYIRTVYRREMGGTGKGNIFLDTYGQPCVLPVQMPANGNLQQAYAVTLMDEQPIYMAHSLFPNFQDKLQPTASHYWYSSQIRSAAKDNLFRRAANLFRRSNYDRSADLYIPIRYTTVIDLAVNMTGYTQPMGQPESPWYYEVPSLGSEIPDGHGGMKKADENDARLYPFRRLLISSESCCMYDGPAFNWHGELDLAQFCLDRWPWEPIGFSLVHDGFELQKAMDLIDRGNMDRIAAKQDMPLGYDINGVAKKEAFEFDPMQPRSRVGFDGSNVDKPFASPVDPSIYEITASEMQFYERLQSQLDYILQTRDIVELGKARALGKGMDEIEALIAANGPVVKDMARGMEWSLGQVGKQVGWIILQYMDAARMMQYIGPESMTTEMFDFDPSSIIPSHMPHENPFDADQKPILSAFSRNQRARWFAANLRFAIQPHSIHELTQMTYRLLLLQMRQRGAPISWATVMQSCDIADTKVPDGNSEQERFWAEKEQEVEHAARLQKIVLTEGIDMGLAQGGPAGQPLPVTGPQGGRPPSGNAPPQLKTKGDGRPTITESK